jgi:hypothetical protein
MFVGTTVHSGIHNLINYIWNKENCLNSGRSQLLYLIYKNGDNNDCSNYSGTSLLLSRGGIGERIGMIWLSGMDRIDLAQSGDRWQLL